MKEELIETELESVTGQRTSNEVKGVVLNGISGWTDKGRNQSV